MTDTTPQDSADGHQLDAELATGTALGEAIRLARKRLRFSQRELAERLGVNQSMISTWERGNAVPKIDSLFSLDLVLGFQRGTLLIEAALIEPVAEDEPQTRSTESGRDVQGDPPFSDDWCRRCSIPFHTWVHHQVCDRDPAYVTNVIAAELAAKPPLMWVAVANRALAALGWVQGRTVTIHPDGTVTKGEQ